MDLKSSVTENPVQLVGFKVPKVIDGLELSRSAPSTPSDQEPTVTYAINGSVVNDPSVVGSTATREPDVGVRLVGFTRSSSLGRGDANGKTRNRGLHLPDEPTAKQRLARLKAEAREWLDQHKINSKEHDREFLEKFVRDNEDHFVRMLENCTHHHLLPPRPSTDRSAPPSPTRDLEPANTHNHDPASSARQSSTSCGSSSSKASSNSSASSNSKQTYHMTTSKSVFEFCADTNTYRFSTERMTQSYEQSFDFSESEDEDEGMSTTSCSSREEDGPSAEGGESKVLPSVASAIEKPELSPGLAAFLVAQELLTSERTYVGVLHLIDQVFQFRIDQENRARPIFQREVITRMFTNVKSIFKLHNDFLLPQLELRIASWEGSPKIGDIMKNFAPFLKMYTEYVKNFDEANTTISFWLAKSPRFAAIIDEIQKLPVCGSLTLQHHMLAPVQRVPRYELLLKDYLRKLPDDAADRADTEEALRLVASAANQSNEAAKKIDMFKKLLEVQDSLGGSVDLVSPTRELLRSERLFKISARSGDHQERHLFLFTDLLLLCSINRRIANRVSSSGPTFRVRAKLPVEGLEVIEGDNLVTANTFYIRNKNKSIELYTQTPEERDDWIRALEHAVEELRKKKSSLKIGMEEDEGYVGCTALWNMVPSPPPQFSAAGAASKTSTEMCHVCKSQFGTFRRKQVCRACTKMVCSKCSGQKVQLPTDNGGRPQRVCKTCLEIFNGSTPSLIMDGSTGGPPNSSSSTSVSTATSPNSSGYGDRSSLVVLRRGVLEVKASDAGVLSGFLHLRTRGKTWTERWFLLKKDFVLYSFAGREDVRAMTSTPVPGFQVAPCERSEGMDRDHVFKLFHKKKVYFFQAATSEDMLRWVASLDKASKAETLSP